MLEIDSTPAERVGQQTVY